MSCMKILYVIHQFYPEHRSGTEQFLLQLATSMQRSGHHAEVLTYNLSSECGFEQPGEAIQVRTYFHDRLLISAVRHKRVPIDINAEITNPATLHFAVRFLKNTACDLVHIAHPMRLASFALAADQLDIPYVVTLTDFWAICPKIYLRTSFDGLCAGPESGRACSRLCPELTAEFVQRRLQASCAMLMRAKAVVAPSRFLADVVTREFSALRIAVVPHGLKLGNGLPNLRTYDRNSSITFAYCGGLSPHKGVHLLLNAFLSLHAENAKLRIYGAAGINEKDYERKLHDIAASDPAINFCGTYERPDVGKVLNGIDVLIIPSLCYETYSFILHEGIAANIPIIASDIGHLAEKVRDSYTGWLFPVGDESALGEKLRQVMDNPAILNDIKGRLHDLFCPLEEEEAFMYERLYRIAISKPQQEVQPAR